MTQYEKVIKGLKCCIPMTEKNGIGDCYNCPYDRKITLEGGITECCHGLMTSALALLKAQEPRTVLYIFKAREGTLGNCPTCGAELMDYYNEKYCGRCRQAVKWE